MSFTYEINGHLSHCLNTYIKSLLRVSVWAQASAQLTYTEWMVILHTQIRRVFNLVPGQKQFSFFSSFFSLLYYDYDYDYNYSWYDIAYQVWAVSPFSHHRRRWAMARENIREKKRKTGCYIINHIIKKKARKKKFNVHRVHISNIYFINGHPFYFRIRTK